MFQTYLINLEKDQERLDFMSKQLLNLNISFQRISGIYGEEYFGPEYNKDLAVKSNRREMTKGEIGCALSHKKCYQKFLASDFPYCLILEDDVLLAKDFKNILETEIIRNENYQKKYQKYLWEYLQFDYLEPTDFWLSRWWSQIKISFKIVPYKFIFILQTILKIPVIIVFAIFEILRSKIIIGPVSFYRDIYLAGAYLINREAAKKLLSLSEKIVYPADMIQTIAKKTKGLKIKYYSPTIAFQQRKDFESNLAVYYK